MSILVQPKDVENVNVGDEAYFSVQATGSETPFTYQWMRKDDIQTTFQPIEGATSEIYTFEITENDRENNVKVCCVIKDGRGASVTSDTATVKYSLWIKSQSDTEQTCDVGDDVTLTVTPAGGTGNYTCQWEIWFYQNKKWSVIADKYSWIDQIESNNSIIVHMKKDWYIDQYQFRCKVSDGVDEIYTEVISFTKK